MMGRSPCCDENGLKKGPWTTEEDEKLVDYIKRNGHGTTRLPGRTDNEIKNFWNTHLKKKLLQMGIDPVTHQRRTDHLALLANLPQLLAAANFNINPMNWDNNPLLLQFSDATQIAKMQLLNNILQVLSSSSSAPNINPPQIHDPQLYEYLLRLNPQFEGIENSPLGSSTFNPNLLPNMENPNQHTTTNCEEENLFSTSCPISIPIPFPSENSIPPLVSHELQSINQEGNKSTNPIIDHISNPSSTSTNLDAWGELVDDGASEAYWREIIDLLIEQRLNMLKQGASFSQKNNTKMLGRKAIWPSAINIAKSWMMGLYDNNGPHYASDVTISITRLDDRSGGSMYEVAILRLKPYYKFIPLRMLGYGIQIADAALESELVIWELLELLPFQREGETSSVMIVDDVEEASSLKAKAVIAAHDTDINSLAVAPNDCLVCSGSQDRTACVWQLPGLVLVLFLKFTRGGFVNTNECIATYDQHEDKVWALAVGKKTEMLATGGSDAVINLWHDSTAAEKEEAFRKEEEGVLKGQEPENAISDAEKRDAEYQVEKALRAVGNEEIRQLLEYVQEWNTKPKLCHLAHFVLFRIFSILPATDIVEIKGIGEVLEGLIPYSQRHFSRIDRLERSTFLLDYTLTGMSVIDPQDNYSAEQLPETAVKDHQEQDIEDLKESVKSSKK
ncbi:hypothetical protein LguiB_015132 [Lonicera macranthoides]